MIKTYADSFIKSNGLAHSFLVHYELTDCTKDLGSSGSPWNFDALIVLQGMSIH